MSVTRGLIIDAPWIGHILEGRKDWEMRSQPTSLRGWFGLIQKGSGQVVGLARLIECGKQLTQSEMIESIQHHRIPERMIRNGEVAKWTIPWKLDDILPFDQPVPYQHKSGAVTWVTFSSNETLKLNQLLATSDTPAEAAISTPKRALNQSARFLQSSYPAENPKAVIQSTKTPVAPLPETKQRVLGRSRLTAGNVRNSHINLSKFVDAFARDVIGGRNKVDAAPRKLEIDWGGPQLVLTDIDGSKSIFRGRGWVRRFFEASDAKEGDVVVVTETAPNKISVRLDRRF